MALKKITHLSTFLRNIRFITFINLIKNLKFIKGIIQLKKLNADINTNEIGGNNREAKYEDVFILSSCINQRDANFYNFNNKQTEFERFSEVCAAVKSVRSLFPTCKIVYLDNSKIEPKLERYLIDIVDDYMNFSTNELMIKAREIRNKGIPWALTNLLYLLSDSKFLNAKNIHLMNGRYSVTEKTLDNSSKFILNNYLYIKFKKLNVSVIYLLFKGICLKSIVMEFKISCILSVMGFSVEDVFALFVSSNIYINEVGLYGKINGEQENYE
jgi:hypothetical protein